LPKLKFIGAGKSDGLGGASCRVGRRSGDGFGAGAGFAGAGCRAGGGGAGSPVDAGGGGVGSGGAVGAGGVGAGGVGAGGVGAGGVGAGGVGAGGVGGSGGVGSGEGGDRGVSGDGVADGMVCRSGSGTVGPWRRPLSNTIVTGAGGGSCSSDGFPRIVTSSNTATMPWISREIRVASRIRHGRRRGGRAANASNRLAPFNGMRRSLSIAQQEHTLLPE
jgi:hypothetical protein